MGVWQSDFTTCALPNVLCQTCAELIEMEAVFGLDSLWVESCAVFLGLYSPHKSHKP